MWESKFGHPNSLVDFHAGVDLAREIDSRYRKELEHAPEPKTRPRDDSDDEGAPKRRRSCLERLRNDVDGARPFLDVYDITLYVDSREKRKNDNHANTRKFDTFHTNNAMVGEKIDLACDKSPR